MSGLLDEVLTAHGGLERWRAVTALTAHGRFGGLLRSRFPENRMANVTVRVQLAEQHAVFHGFPQEDQFRRRRIAGAPDRGEIAPAMRYKQKSWHFVAGCCFRVKAKAEPIARTRNRQRR
jgi:hypothetical protein